MRSVAIYARVSSEQQAQQATIDSQVSALKQRVAADGHVLLPQDVYLDDGFSGSTLLRPALERLRDRVAEGGIDRLYVHSPDRLARKYAYQVLLLDELHKQGVTTVFLNGPSGKTAEDELLVQVQGMIAEYERAKILERSRRGKIHRARRGEISPLGCAPYGFAYVKKRDGEPASYRVLLHEAKVVRDIFNAFVQEQKSISDIARELSARKVPTRRGAARWGRPTIWTILRNPAHMGKAAYGKSEAADEPRLLRPRHGSRQGAQPRKRTSPDAWIRIDVPAIVSPELFEAAQAQLQRNKRLAQRNARGARYLLQGLTVCARCGHSFSGRSGRGRAHYYCQGAQYCGGERVCWNPSVAGPQLDDYVWHSVSELLRDPARVLDEWLRRQQSGGMAAELTQQRDEAARVLAAHQRSLKRLVDAYEVGAIDVNELKVRSEAVRARIERAQRDVVDAEQRLRETVQLRAIVTHLDDFAARVSAGLDKLSWTERRTIIRTLVDKIEIDETAATVVYRLPSLGRTPTPRSDRSPPSDAAPGNGDGAMCRLRSYSRRCVTTRGPNWLYLSELLRGDRAIDPRLVAKLFAESTDEHVQELVIESARVIAEAMVPSVMPVMARLTATYAAPPGKRADKFFRGVRRILSDLTEEEFQDMREIFRRVANVPLDPWPPWFEVRSTRHAPPTRDVGDPPGEPILLVCTGINAKPTPSTWTPAPPRQTETFELGEPPSTTTRILHLLEVNGLAVPGVSGQLNVPVPTLIESAAVRRLHELLTV